MQALHDTSTQRQECLGREPGRILGGRRFQEGVEWIARSGVSVSIFQYRRRLLSLLSRVYSAQPSDIVRLSAELREELLLACALGPSAAINLRCPAAPVIVASDSSTASQASVYTPATAAASKEFFRHSLQKVCGADCFFRSSLIWGAEVSCLPARSFQTSITSRTRCGKSSAPLISSRAW